MTAPTSQELVQKNPAENYYLEEGKESEKSFLEKIPNELKYYIFSYLPVEMFSTIASLNSRFRDLICISENAPVQFFSNFRRVVCRRLARLESSEELAGRLMGQITEDFYNQQLSSKGIEYFKNEIINLGTPYFKKVQEITEREYYDSKFSNTELYSLCIFTQQPMYDVARKMGEVIMQKASPFFMQAAQEYFGLQDTQSKLLAIKGEAKRLSTKEREGEKDRCTTRMANVHGELLQKRPPISEHVPMYPPVLPPPRRNHTLYNACIKVAPIALGVIAAIGAYAYRESVLSMAMRNISI